MTTSKWIIALVVLVILGLGVYLFMTQRIPGDISLFIGESVSSLDRSAHLRLDSIITDGDDAIVMTATNNGQVSTLKFTPTDTLKSFGEYQVRLCGALPPDSAKFTVSKGDLAPVCKAVR